MTVFLKQTSVVIALAWALTACATSPTYPIVASPPAPKPAPPPVQTPPPPEPQAVPAPPPETVTSQPLGPVAGGATPPGAEESPVVIEPSGRGQASSARDYSPPPAAPPASLAPRRYAANGKVVAARRMYRDYEVRKGDHLDLIARDLQTTRESLVEANRLKKPYELRPGQHLKAPIEKAYVAASGDTLELVAKRFEVSAADLADLNALPERHRLRPGEELALPSSFHDRGPVLLPENRSESRYAGRYAPRGYVPAERVPAPGADAYAGYHNNAPYQPITPPVSATPSPALSDAEVTASGRGRFVWPVRGEILSGFGVKDVGRRNDGLDVKAPQGTAVRAAAAGEIVYAGDQVPGFGNLVLVKHANGWVTAYAHLDKVDVKMRQMVAQAEPIGEVGQSGGAAEPELHFEVRYAPTPSDKAKPVDPLLVLPQ